MALFQPLVIFVEKTHFKPLQIENSNEKGCFNQSQLKFGKMTGLAVTLMTFIIPQAFTGKNVLQEKLLLIIN